MYILTIAIELQFITIVETGVVTLSFLNDETTIKSMIAAITIATN
jgi:hypothetical protein